MRPIGCSSLSIVVGCLALWVTSPSIRAQGLPYKQTQDVVFAEVHGTGLLMDVFVPSENANGLAIVDVASGAWYSDRGKIRDHTLAQMYNIFCSRGYTVFAIRPGSKTRYSVPEMDSHVKLGIRHIKKQAEKYSIAKDKLGLTGASAGGHLASLAALTPQEADGLNSDVAAVAVFFPPTDFLDWGNGKPVERKFVEPLAFPDGRLDHPEEDFTAAAKKISPFYQVKQKTIPFLLIHGDADEVVPLSHSEKLLKALKEQGTDAELIVKKGGGHPWLTLPEEVKSMADWFDSKLK